MLYVIADFFYHIRTLYFAKVAWLVIIFHILSWSDPFKHGGKNPKLIEFMCICFYGNVSVLFTFSFWNILETRAIYKQLLWPILWNCLFVRQVDANWLTHTFCCELLLG